MILLPRTGHPITDPEILVRWLDLLNSKKADADPGTIGEYISSTVLSGGALALTTSTPLDVTSITLTPGDWDVWGSVGVISNAATVTTAFLGWVSAVSATQPTQPNNGAEVAVNNTFPAGANILFPIGMARFSVVANTIVYLSASMAFTVNTLSAYGIIGARRAR